MKKTIFVQIHGCDGPVVKLTGDELELQTMLRYLPPPFQCSSDEVATVTWDIAVQIGSLDHVWPVQSSLLGVYRAGLDDPFPWYIEAMTAQEGIIWLMDESADQRASIVVDRIQRRIEFKQERMDGKWLARIIRNIFSANLIEQGWIPLHACAFAANGKAIVCVGERGSGKSTLAFLGAALKGAEFLSDDIVLIRPANTGEDWDVIGWPRRVGIRRALLEEVYGEEKVRLLQPKLRRNVLASKMHPRGERLAFDPDELNTHLGIRFTGHVRCPLRLATIESSACVQAEISWKTELYRSAFQAKGEDLRYLVDVFGLFSQGVTKADQMVKPYGVEIETATIKLPYAVLGALGSLWPSMTN